MLSKVITALKPDFLKCIILTFKQLSGYSKEPDSVEHVQ